MIQDKLSFAAFESLLSAPRRLEKAENIMCSVSGGSDSDVVIDLLKRTLPSLDNVHFVFFNTGIEFKATHDHLDYLEGKYDIKIERIRAEKPIPICAREFGTPFLSKQVSEYIQRLQRHGFQWEDDTFENLDTKYPNCQSALRWWCNEWGEGSKFNISRNKWLKEFMLLNPPDFAISNKCCHYTKKVVAKKYKKEHDIDMSITGMRKAEGGVRASAYKSCFSQKDDGCSEYRPLWYFKDDDKQSYEQEYDVVHSACYTEYGMKRTGCAGCPCAKGFENELQIIQEHEPKLFKAVNNIFGKSYEYTLRYREFARQRNE